LTTGQETDQKILIRLVGVIGDGDGDLPVTVEVVMEPAYVL
jgi:hypothetical protein